VRLDTSATNLFIVPAPDANEYGAFGGMGIGKGNGNTPKKPAPVPLCPPQVPHDDLGSKPVTERLSYFLILHTEAKCSPLEHNVAAFATCLGINNDQYKGIGRTFSHKIDLDNVTLEMKSISAR
jgi:hypothetical protein